MIRKSACLMLFLLAAGPAQAQFALGITTSQYNTINSLYLNPANIANCPEKLTVNLFFVNLSVDNNLGTLNDLTHAFSNSPYKTFQPTGAVHNFSMMAPYAEVRGPSVLISSKGKLKSAIAITTRVRIMNELTNFNQSLYNTIVNPTSVASQTVNYNSSHFNWTAQMWSELGLTYGAQLIDRKNNQLRVGVSLRYLGGYGYMGIKGNNLDVTYKKGTDSVSVVNSDLEYASNIISPAGAFTNNVNTGAFYSGFLGTTAANGTGTDLGVTFTHTFNGDGEDPNGPFGDEPGAHRLNLSAAVTDIGVISYKSGYNSTVSVYGNGYVTQNGLATNAQNLTQFRNYVLAQQFSVDTGFGATRLHLPTALVLGADYQVYGHIYAAVNYMGNLVNRQQFGNFYYNQWSITPRYDTWLLSFAMPFTYSSLAHDYKLGVGVRCSGFYFGSDDMLALISNKQHGFDCYIGFSIPIRKKSTQS